MWHHHPFRVSRHITWTWLNIGIFNITCLSWNITFLEIHSFFLSYPCRLRLQEVNRWMSLTWPNSSVARSEAPVLFVTLPFPTWLEISHDGEAFFVSGRFINNEVPCFTVRKEKHETVGRYHSAGLCQKVVYTSGCSWKQARKVKVQSNPLLKM